MYAANSPALLLPFSLLLRILVGLHSYSGENTPPLFGDYEAQRHWMEVTVHTPASSWYKNTSSNNLEYWGLDYPPLTAYQSLLHGLAVSAIEPDAVALYTSRGYETPSSKVLMRWTVLSSDLVVFFPAALWFVSVFYRGRRACERAWALAMVLLTPPLILIDHGHFQYNCISLGFALAAAAAILEERKILGSVLFCLSLNHKQMSMYYAPAFFAHLLGLCLRTKRPILAVASLAATVGLTFAACWAPLVSSPSDVMQILSRLVPLRRGLYEDYVANFWCATSLIVKWKRLFSIPALVRMCGAATLAAMLPSMVVQIVAPTPRGFLLCMLNSSLAFFLFAFQVHEKSILLPLLPATLLSLEEPEMLRFFVPFATFSMFPLLQRDGLVLAYFALLALYLLLAHPPMATTGAQTRSEVEGTSFKFRRRALDVCWAVSLAGIAALHLASALITPPVQYPFLHPALITTFSFLHFAAIFVYTNVRQMGERSFSAEKKLD